MIHIELSSHARGYVQQTAAAIAEDEQRIEEHLRAVERRRAEHKASRRWWQVWTRYRQQREITRLRDETPVVDAEKLHRLAGQQAGASAEDQVADDLRGALSDDWTLLSGYTNRRGEVDHLLVGPGGVWAIEVKGRGVRVHVRGDEWTYEKFDRYRNPVESGVLENRRGRSWGRQVSEVAGRLEWFLGERQVPVRVQSVVVVVNDRAEVGAVTSLQIDGLHAGTASFLRQLDHEPETLDASTAVKVVGLVQRDHAFNEEQRKQARRRQ
jgi:hypothetical protein